MEATTKPKRGRPPTGEAKSAAERKRHQIERDRFIVWASAEERGDLTEQDLTLGGLIEGIRQCITKGQPAILAGLLAEAMRRTEAKREARQSLQTTGKVTPA